MNLENQGAGYFPTDIGNSKANIFSWNRTDFITGETEVINLELECENWYQAEMTQQFYTIGYGYVINRHSLNFKLVSDEAN